MVLEGPRGGCPAHRGFLYLDGVGVGLYSYADYDLARGLANLTTAILGADQCDSTSNLFGQWQGSL